MQKQYWMLHLYWIHRCHSAKIYPHILNWNLPPTPNRSVLRVCCGARAQLPSAGQQDAPLGASSPASLCVLCPLQSRSEWPAAVQTSFTPSKMRRQVVQRRQRIWTIWKKIIIKKRHWWVFRSTFSGKRKHWVTVEVQLQQQASPFTRAFPATGWRASPLPHRPAELLQLLLSLRLQFQQHNLSPPPPCSALSSPRPDKDSGALCFKYIPEQLIP